MASEGRETPNEIEANSKPAVGKPLTVAKLLDKFHAGG